MGCCNNLHDVFSERIIVHNSMASFHFPTQVSFSNSKLSTQYHSAFAMD